MGRPPTKPTVSSVPELIGLWHPDNTLDPKTITTGSDKKVLWKCPNHDFPYSASPHQWFEEEDAMSAQGRKWLVDTTMLGPPEG